MNEPHTPMATNDPDQAAPRSVLTRLAGWIRTQKRTQMRTQMRPPLLTQMNTHLRQQMRRYLHLLLGRRIWIILPGQERDSGQTLVLPFSLARLLQQRARETDRPVEALLPALLRTALIERSPPDPVELAWLSLTEREQEVACLIAAGLNNRQIAARLTITHNTVRTHARRIVRKFGCPNRRSLPDLRAYCPKQE